MQKQKYDMRQDDSGWTVYVIETGLTVVVEGVLQVGLDLKDADKLVDLINQLAREAKDAPKQ
jgi:hypothetical protein